MRVNGLYGLKVKLRLFKLGGFIVKKKYKKLHGSISIFTFRNLKYCYSILNPVLSLFQILNIFKFYINLVLVSKNFVATVLLNSTVISLPLTSITRFNYFFKSKFIGGLFSNYLVFSWYLVQNNFFKLKNFPALCFILNFNIQNFFSRSLYNIGVPTIGFYNFNIKKDFLTFPIFLDHNVYILYFFLRLFLRLLSILKFKI